MKNKQKEGEEKIQKTSQLIKTFISSRIKMVQIAFTR